LSSKKPIITPAQDKLNKYGIALVCERTANCIPQRVIAKEIGVQWATLMSWIDADSDRAKQYARAREAQADKLAEDLLAIADESEVEAIYEGDAVKLELSGVAVARNRLRVDARKWLASKMAPKRYGEKLQQEVNVTTDSHDLSHLSVSELEEIKRKLYVKPAE
jgi:hypothetical protein